MMGDAPPGAVNLMRLARNLLPALAALLLVALPQAPAQAAGTCPADTTPDFTDSCHHEYVLYNVDQAKVDVLIVPAADPYLLREASVLKDSVLAWDEGIDALAPAWLASGLELRPYNVGFETVPRSAMLDPEVVILTAEYNPVLLAGIGLQAPLSWCHGLPLLSARAIADDPGFHAHEGSSWGMLTAECGSGGKTCFVVNTNFLWLPDAENRRDMYDLNSHELGHCLGIGHVGDAMDFTARSYPRDDIMSYETDGHDAGRVLCVSTLNVLALQQAYGHLLGQAGYPVNPAGTYVHQAPSLWATAACPEPTGTWTDIPL